MTASEILEKKEVLTKQDIMILCEVEQTTAYKIMKAVRSVSDRLGIKGIIHKKDYLDYINRFDKKNEPFVSSGQSTNSSSFVTK